MDLEYPDGATLLDLDEIEGLKFKHITTRGELDHLEQANIQEGMRWLARTRTKNLLNEGFVRELHRRLFGKVWRWAGTFRKTEKNIGIDPRYISVQLKVLLDDVAYWIEHKTFEPLELAARLHHRLVYIHLFPNGNGRHARIMVDAVLTKMLGHPPVNWAGSVDLNKLGERRQKYLDSLRSADQGDFVALLEFVTSTDINQ